MILIFSFFAISLSQNNSNNKKSFSFSIRRNQKITLISPKLIDLSYQKSKSHWFYIHFLIDDLSYVASLIPIDTKNLIFKNTFILYLSQDQFLKISNICLAKIFEPEDKFDIQKDALEKSEYLLITGPNNFILNENSNLFNIESKSSINSYIIKIKSGINQDKIDLIHRLANEPSIRAISIYNFPIIKNNINAGFTQKNSAKIKKDDNSGFYYTDRYLNAKGINGEGQIVTLEDTLIDFHHSMFNDENSKFDINVQLDHRKFMYYYYNGTIEKLEKSIGRNEHGTHVAGSIAGETSCSSEVQDLSVFNGNAPKAKLIFFSLGKASANTIAETMVKFDSRISSNSWDYMGFDDEGNFVYGDLAYHHPNIIYIFAAGNEYQGGNFTVDDPSGSKNVLAVGSISDFYERSHFMRFQDSENSSFYIDAEEVKMFDIYFKGILGTNANKSDIIAVNADETDNCDTFSDTKYYLAYASSPENASWIKKCYLYDSQGIFLSYETEKVHSFIERLNNRSVTLFDITAINESKSVEHAYFSSGGPGNKGVIKPDVVAPGTRIISAKSVKGSNKTHGCRDDGISDVTIKEGTSQATPNVAGAAALISQYFQSGKWKYLLTPDGSAMRAMLINSCRHPTNSKSPDVLYGHGVVDLSTLLPFDNEFGIQVSKSAEISQNDHKVATLKVKSNKVKLQITMSYLDPMMDMHSPLLLTHDLDLVVISPSGKLVKGDHIEWGDTQHLSTNEKVIIEPDEIEVGEYAIHVLSSTFVNAAIDNETQDFSVVATGDIDNSYLNFASAHNCLCDECDEKNPLHCKCGKNSIGPICQASISHYKSKHFAVTLKGHEIKRIKIKSKNAFDKINFINDIQIDAIDDPGRASVWIDKQCHLELNEFESTIGNFNEISSLNATINYKSGEICLAIFNNNYQEASFDILVSKKNNIMYVYIAIGCFVGIILLVIIGILIVKSRRNKVKDGFTEIKSIN